MSDLAFIALLGTMMLIVLPGSLLGADTLIQRRKGRHRD